MSGGAAGRTDTRERLFEVADIALDPAAFRSVQLHGNIARYRFLLDLCALLSRSLVPESGTGQKHFHPFTASPVEMGALFEAFVRNFLKHEQGQFHVSRDKVPWDVKADAADLKWLPDMQLDILLSSAARRMVIETKFYAQPFSERFDTQKIRSDHLYQLLTYLRHLGARAGPHPSGLLLYAGAAQSVALRYNVAGFPIRIEALNLDQPWPGIRSDLLTMVAEREE